MGLLLFGSMFARCAWQIASSKCEIWECSNADMQMSGGDKHWKVHFGDKT